ncbi:thioredoxin-dependent thiol peroxidase [Buchnera aphidicola]|uniref:thioredoxin-dependent thiol peroxidase n=1 Tax=Buchnera aphidicola TaxID=9 RepID=UPI0031B69197
MKKLKVGDIAPKFALLDQDNTLVALDHFLGKNVLLFFYPKAMTPSCTIQACNLRDKLEIFKRFSTEIIGISIDKPKKLLRFIEKEMLNYTLLSDFEHKVSKKFGVWKKKTFIGKDYYGVHRTSFLINSKGFIEKIFNDFQANTHHKLVLNYIKLNLS